MTSEEIKNLKRGFGDAMDWTEAPEQFAHRAIDGIWEIAFQLAVMNERESAKRTSPNGRTRRTRRRYEVYASGHGHAVIRRGWRYAECDCGCEFNAPTLKELRAMCAAHIEIAGAGVVQ